MPEAVADPDPRCVARADVVKPLAADIGPKPIEFEISAFPFHGNIPGENKAFMDKIQGARLGHTSPRGALHWEDESYSDKRTLLYLPKGFDLSKPALIVVFFHGNHVRLMRDVVARQQVPAQLVAAGLNAVLVAPQFAFDVADSSAGSFWERGVFKQFLAEAARHLGQLHGDPCAQSRFDKLKVVLVAYSGGYNPAAYALHVGGANSRVHGVVLLDALYGETDKFDTWIEQHRSAFFFSAYSDSSRPENMELRRLLAARQVELTPATPLRLTAGSVVFLPTGPDISHNDFMTRAWVRDPLTVVLSRIEGFPMSPRSRDPAQPRPSVAATPRQPHPPATVPGPGPKATPPRSHDTGSPLHSAKAAPPPSPARKPPRVSPTKAASPETPVGDVPPAPGN